ncbi:hypothetical protein SLS62_007532 [Diatrype stigma]|uniref:Uncharacterized protein n=1 Tax=Diatrype stigma TaxID=117547 RepID=A0AAN9UP44_9PEZI
MEYHNHYDHKARKHDGEGDEEQKDEEEAVLEGGEELAEAAETATLMPSGHHSSIRTAHHYRQRTAPLPARRKSHRVHCVLNFILTAVLLCSIAFVWLRDAATRRQSASSPDVERYHYYSPALEATKHGSRITHFNHTKWSPFSPSKSTTLDYVNGNWSALLRTGMISLSEAELRRAGAPPDSVRLPPESSGGYLAYLASHHHLHCLYLLHQSLHASHYEQTGEGMWAASMSAERRVSHWDHCVEALRQYVVCEADATVVTHSWFEGYDKPVASQANPRRCADWDAHFRWQLDRQVTAPPASPPASAPGQDEGEGGEDKGEEGHHQMWSLKKPPGAVERPVLPVEPPPGSMSMYLPV